MDSQRLGREIITIARDFNRGGLSVGTAGNLWENAPPARAGTGRIKVIPAWTGMAWINHWIPRRPVPDAALPPTSL